MPRSGDSDPQGALGPPRPRQAMKLGKKAEQELVAIFVTSAYFAACAGVLIVVKELILAEYHIEFHGLGLALLGSLVIAKVVLVMERVPIGSWLRNHPASFDVVLRTALYALGVLVALILEKAFEARHEHGGFGASIACVFQHPDMPHVFANAICVTCALLGFNALSVLRRYFGGRALVRLFVSCPSGAAGNGSAREQT